MIDIIDKILEIHPSNGSFVYIGANQYASTIWYSKMKHDWCGVLIEPQQKEFNVLCKNYESHPKILKYCFALSDVLGQRMIYGHPNDGYGNSTSNSGSSLFPIENSKFSFEVQSLDYDTYVSIFAIPTCLIIDTEGYDSDIVINLLARNYKPKFIVSENMSNHYYVPDACLLEKSKIDTLLAHGYQCIENNGHDALFILS